MCPHKPLPRLLAMKIAKHDSGLCNQGIKCEKVSFSIIRADGVALTREYLLQSLLLGLVVVDHETQRRYRVLLHVLAQEVERLTQALIILPLDNEEAHALKVTVIILFPSPLNERQVSCCFTYHVANIRPHGQQEQRKVYPGNAVGRIQQKDVVIPIKSTH